MGIPFAVERTVTWGECDAAGIIYMPRVFDHAVEAVEAFYREVLEASWIDLNWRRGMGAPFVRAECDFIRAPACDDRIRLEVRIARVGRSSVTYEVTALGADGAQRFRSTLVACFIQRPEFKSAEIPPDVKIQSAATVEI